MNEPKLDPTAPQVIPLRADGLIAVWFSAVDSELSWPVLVAHQMSASSVFVLLWAELAKGSVKRKKYVMTSANTRASIDAK